jgi:hypothetical protein
VKLKADAASVRTHARVCQPAARADAEALAEAGTETCSATGRPTVAGDALPMKRIG